MLSLQQKKEIFRLKRIKKIIRARKSFWEYQKNNSPNDFKDERTYLLCLSLALQSFYEEKPISYLASHPIEHHKKLDLSATTIPITFESEGQKTLITVDASDLDILIIEVPRRHHKSHTLINFECWVFGQNPKEIIVTAAHNANLANEFSQYVRDGIEEQRLKATNIIYADIFPRTKTKHGDRSKTRWSLDGNYLSYTGSGILYPPTGKGGSLGVFDDPVRSARDAFNEDYQNKLWTGYSTGWLPVLEGKKKHIFVMTPWTTDDPGSRIIADEDGTGQKVGVFNCTAYSESQGMLCEDILSKRSFDILQARMDPVIFSGNFLSKRIPNVGRMYTSFQFYDAQDLPKSFDEIFCYVDTADAGDDFLCSPLAGIINCKDEFGLPIKKAYMLDVLYTKEGLEITEQMMVDFLVKNNQRNKELFGNTSMKVKVESQTGGGYFASNIEKEIRKQHPKEKIFIEKFHQTENKNARINTNSHTVMKYIYFPKDWRSRNQHWAAYSNDMMRYMRIGKNEHDDSADATTGIAERINTEMTMLEALKMRKMVS